jgi:catechol 2,3-dioxygenase-like lactoylglutathione lyase family enzyme
VTRPVPTHPILQRVLLLALAAAVSTPALRAQIEPALPPETKAPAQSPPFNGIAHIAIRVQSIAASVAFYNKLGFEEAFAMHGKDGSVSQSFIKINDKQFIELYPVNPANPTQDKPEFLHLCFEGVDLNAIHDFYVAEGLTPISVRTAGAGNLLFTMKGPLQFRDPQNIEYTQYMPGSLHSKDAGLHLGPNRVAGLMIQVDLAMQDPAAAKSYYLEKLGFHSHPNSIGLFLPEAGGRDDFPERVQIVPVDQLGAKSSITLFSGDLNKAEAQLKKEQVSYSRNGNTILLTDPDANIVRIGADGSSGGCTAQGASCR